MKPATSAPRSPASPTRDAEQHRGQRHLQHVAVGEALIAVVDQLIRELDRAALGELAGSLRVAEPKALASSAAGSTFMPAPGWNTKASSSPGPTRWS